MKFISLEKMKQNERRKLVFSHKYFIETHQKLARNFIKVFTALVFYSLMN